AHRPNAFLAYVLNAPSTGFFAVIFARASYTRYVPKAASKNAIRIEGPAECIPIPDPKKKPVPIVHPTPNSDNCHHFILFFFSLLVFAIEKSPQFIHHQ